MKMLKSVLALMLLVAAITSCDGGGTPSLRDNYMEQEYTGCFNYLYKKSLNTGVISTGTTYMFRWRADYTADVYVYNAKFSAKMPDGINISFEGLTWRNVDGVKIVNAKDVVPTGVTINGAAVDVSAYVVDNLRVEVLERRLMDSQSSYIPVINVSMTMGDMEAVTVQRQRVYFGSTGVVNNEANTNFVSKSPYYAVTLDPSTMLADIDIYQAEFAANMPAMDMNFANVSFSVSNLGYKLTCEELIPTIKDVPYPNYKITGLVGDATFASGLDLRFNCMETYSVQAKVGFPLE